MSGVFRKLCYIVFAISGMTALIYELVWVRQLQLVLGSSNYAVSLMLTAVMSGFALGSYLFRNISGRSKNPLMLFSWIQFAIGAYALLGIITLNQMSSTLISLLGSHNLKFMQFIISFSFLIIPTTLFGATWPVITQACARQNSIGKDAAKLYSFNSLGSMLGALGAGFILLPWLGISKTIVIASGLNLLLALATHTYAKAEVRQ